MKKLSLLISSLKSRLIAGPLAILSGIPLFISKVVDIRDLHVYGGISLLGYGFYIINPAYGLIISGIILLSMGLFIGKRGPK